MKAARIPRPPNAASPDSLPLPQSALVELAVGGPRYEHAIQRVDSLRRGLLSEGKAAAARAAAAASQKQAEAAQAEGVERLTAKVRMSAVVLHLCRQPMRCD